MKNIAISSAVAALISNSSAIKMSAAPDVYGPNGGDYKNDSATYDLSRIGIDIKTAGSGKKCALGAWTTVTWQGYLKDGTVVTDFANESDGRAKVFSLGASEVWKCWDLAIPQLTEGTRALLHCPYDLAYGNAYTWAPVGGEPIPLHSDIDFDITITECDKMPDRTEFFTQPVTTTMQPGVCMYLHMFASEDVEHDLVLSAVDNGPTPLNVLIEEKVLEDKSQHWFLDMDAKHMFNEAHPELRLSLLPNHEVGLVPTSDAVTQFYYDPHTSALTNGNLAVTELIYASRPHDDATVLGGLQSTFGDLKTAKWRIEYCNQYFGS